MNARADTFVKDEAEKILRHPGISPSEAAEMLYRKLIEDGDATITI
ncbi:MAG: hypothetical protein LBH69_02885 [Methanomassiliicoccaceae archaeon]|jgi:antitoxin component of RelBE/YafQ-DinJ toxin-antitoxin module|nr:hypothetical protein [Methanomassiliicoccaceae archaeon]